MCKCWAERTYLWERWERTERGLPGFQRLGSALCQLALLGQSKRQNQETDNCVRGVVCIGTTFITTEGEERKGLVFPVKSDGIGVLGGGILQPRCHPKNKSLHRWNGVGLGERQHARQGKQWAAWRKSCFYWYWIIPHLAPATLHRSICCSGFCLYFYHHLLRRRG